MKNLNEYISNDMKSFKTSLEESLLDDEDDLLDASDEAVENALSIGEKYKIKSIVDYKGISRLIKLNKSWLKNNGIKLHQYQTDFPFHQAYKYTRTSKPTNSMLLFGNVLLRLNADLLNNAKPYKIMVTPEYGKTLITPQNAPALYSILCDSGLSPEVYIIEGSTGIGLEIFETTKKSTHDMGLQIHFAKK